MEIRDQTYKDVAINIDGTTYKNCTFLCCRLVFSAVAPMSLAENTFIECTWQVTGAAADTVNFLRTAFCQGGLAGEELTDRMIGVIKGRSPPLTGEGAFYAARASTRP
jgi:hypothetical protein